MFRRSSASSSVQEKCLRWPLLDLHHTNSTLCHTNSTLRHTNSTLRHTNSTFLHFKVRKSSCYQSYATRQPFFPPSAYIIIEQVPIRVNAKYLLRIRSRKNRFAGNRCRVNVALYRYHSMYDTTYCLMYSHQWEITTT